MHTNTFWSQFVSLSAIILFTFLVGCSNNWMPNSILYVTQPHHEPFLTLEQCTLVATFNELGKTLTHLPAGYLAAKFGRKKILIYMLLVNFISWILLCSFSTMIVICVARFLSGSSEGMYSVIGSITAAELSSPKYRSIFSSLISMAFNLGLLFEAFLSATFGSYKMLNMANAAICICFMPTVLWFLESPYYLVHTHREQKAKNNLRMVRPSCSEEDMRKEFEAIKASVSGKISTKASGDNFWWQTVKQKSVQTAMACAMFLTIVPSLTGNPQIRLFMTVIMPSNEYVSNASYPLVVYGVAFGGSLLSIWVLQSVSRRLLSIVTCLIICILHTVNCVCCFFNEQPDPATMWKWAFLGGNVLFMGLQATTLSPLNDTIRAEILPFSIKEIGNSLCLVVRSATLVVSYKLFIGVEKTVGLYANYAFFAAVAAVSCLLTYTLLPETAGKSLTDVQNELECNKRSDKIERY